MIKNNMSAQHTPDYSINMRDGSGRTIRLVIIGACIDDLIADGYDRETAKEDVEGNQFGNAIARGDIGADAWLER